MRICRNNMLPYDDAIMVQEQAFDRYPSLDAPLPAEVDDGVWSLVGRYAIAGALSVLTDMERQIFLMYRGPYSAALLTPRKEAARQLGMHQATFDVHVKNINKKLKNYIATLDAIANSCNPAARAAIHEIRQEIAVEERELKERRERLRSRFSSLEQEVLEEEERWEERERIVTQKTFALACDQNLLDETERFAYQALVLEGISKAKVAADLGVPVEELASLLSNVRRRLSRLSQDYEVRLVPKSASA